MKLTPREPTPEMLEAALNPRGGMSIPSMTRIWRAMHDAAPSAEPVADEPVAYRLRHERGHWNTIDRDELEQRQSAWVQERWKAAEPLYTRPAAAPAERTLLEQTDLDASPDYQKGRSDGRQIGYDMGFKHGMERAQRVPLTDDQITDAVREADLDWHHGWTLDETEPNRFTQLVRALERAHGIGAKP